MQWLGVVDKIPTFHRFFEVLKGHLEKKRLKEGHSDQGFLK